MNFYQAGFMRLTDRDVETTTAIRVCQLKNIEFWFFYSNSGSLVLEWIKRSAINIGSAGGGFDVRRSIFSLFRAGGVSSEVTALKKRQYKLLY